MSTGRSGSRHFDVFWERCMRRDDRK